MKVLLVSSGSGSRGGGEIYLTLLAEGLIEQGCEVSVMVPAHSIMDELAGQFPDTVRVHRVPFHSTYQRKTRGIGAAFDRRQQATIAAFFRAEQPDIIHLNQQVAEDGLDLLLAAEQSGIPWVSTIHVARSAASLNARLGGVRDWVAHRALRRARRPFITVSAASQAQLGERLKDESIKMRVVHNGVRGASDAQFASARQQARNEWGVGDAATVFGMVGRIEAQKNPLALIDYIDGAKLQEQVSVVWIGDGALRGALEDQAKAKNVGLTIDGWRTDAALRLAGFDVFLLPSEFEGLPLAILEAMHAGLPVMASKTDGIPEAVEHDVTGYLCESRQDWLTYAQNLATDIGLRQRMSAAAKRAASRSFSISAMARNTLDVYQAELSA